MIVDWDVADHVKHKYTDEVGTIRAIYIRYDQVYLDVETAYQTYWETPAYNWKRIFNE